MHPTTAIATTALARVIGPLMFLFGLAMALRRIDTQAVINGFYADAAKIFLGGFISLLCGLIIVSMHNIWRSPTTILITALGWLTILRGVVLIFAPDAIRTVGDAFAANPTIPLVAGLIAAALGAWFSYVGYLAGDAAK
ncbi:MAG: hypothetical protein JNJ73_07275 [Hyphomonadaceae bacterium]|nr:hypothetical protein [Hyphomonadaceae bacterium]